jgi:hypothetical protein
MTTCPLRQGLKDAHPGAEPPRALDASHGPSEQPLARHSGLPCVGKRDGNQHDRADDRLDAPPPWSVRLEMTAAMVSPRSRFAVCGWPT